ncbi:MAG TPA: DegT/DnrJ/EryC1/StrS family aminotransferase [Candidatus Eisenbacteria bacterium]
MTSVPFNAIAVQDAGLREEILAAMRRVVERGRFVLGEEVSAFEAELAANLGAAHAVGVGTGTDAIRLALQAAGVVAGDDVLTVSHTATFTALAISMLGARPVFADIEPGGMMLDPARIESAITPRTRALVPVHLYGQAADLVPMVEIARRRGLALIEDCAQAHGAQFLGRAAGTFGTAAALSFYPTKNLGAYGDGGAVVTSDPALAERVRQLRNGGQADRYRHVELGVNSRLDELQAAILRVKLRQLERAVAARRTLAARYDAALTGVAPARELPGRRHAYHLYVVRHARRDALREHLTAAGVGSQVHYPIPVHRQPAYAHLGLGPGSLPETERAAAEVLSLPLYPGLTAEQQQAVIDAVNAFSGVHA